MDIDIGQPGEFRVPRIHAPDMGSEWYLPAMRVVRVIEVVVPLWVRTEGGIVDVRRQGQRRAAAPTADQLRSDQFPFFPGASIGPKESIERADARLIFAQAHICAVATEDVRLRHRRGDPGLARIAEDELAGLDRPSLARERLAAAAFDRRLVDAVLVAQRIAVAGLGAEVLRE